MSTPIEVHTYDIADFEAERSATEHAAAGKWEQFAQPGFESKVGEIAVNAAHDLALYEEADREWDKMIAMDALHEEATNEDIDRDIEKEQALDALHEEALDENDVHEYEKERAMDRLHEEALDENSEREYEKEQARLETEADRAAKEYPEHYYDGKYYGNDLDGDLEASSGLTNQERIVNGMDDPEDDEDPLAGDVDRFVHPDETRDQAQIDHDERYAVEPY